MRKGFKLDNLLHTHTFSASYVSGVFSSLVSKLHNKGKKDGIADYPAWGPT